MDSQSASVIKLNNSTILYLREVNKFLALVCILREDNFSRQSEFLFREKRLNFQLDERANFVVLFPLIGVIDYNVLCFREAISQVFELRTKNQKSSGEGSTDDEDDDEFNSNLNGSVVQSENSILA